jgi:iron-sulfur cluster assembly protein
MPVQRSGYRMLSLTDAAVEAVKKAMEADARPAGTCLRVLVKGGGCSGLSYDLSFEEQPDEGDRTIEKNGLRILVDPRSELYLAGTEMDYTTGLNGKGFVFRNPNATGTCGCGNSFSA